MALKEPFRGLRARDSERISKRFNHINIKMSWTPSNTTNKLKRQRNRKKIYNHEVVKPWVQPGTPGQEEAGGPGLGYLGPGDTLYDRE
jgi:hypothetical protein